jgi:hypothetical protein
MVSGWNVDSSAWKAGIRLDSIEPKDVFLGTQAAPADLQTRSESDLLGWFIAHIDWLNRSI